MKPVNGWVNVPKHITLSFNLPLIHSSFALMLSLRFGKYLQRIYRHQNLSIAKQQGKSNIDVTGTNINFFCHLAIQKIKSRLQNIIHK
jgi:hypothetical protein